MSKSEQQTLPAQERRLATYEEMPAQLKKVADKCRTLEAKGARGTVMTKYTLGKEIQAVIAEEATYGANAVEQLAAVLGKTSTELYALGNMTLAYSIEEVEELSLREMAGGGYISLGHILEICKVKKAADRQKLWNRVFAEDLSVGQLQQEVSAAYDKKNTRSGGRKPSKPSSPMAGMQQIVNETQTLINRMPLWEKHVYDEFDEMEPTKFDPQVVDRAQKAVANWTEVEANAGQNRVRCEKILKRAEKVVAQRVKEQEKEAAAEAKALEGKGKPKKKVA